MEGTDSNAKLEQALQQVALLEKRLRKTEQQLQSSEQQRHSVQRQLDWFKRQIFGEKSERRLASDPRQLCLGELVSETPPAPSETVRAYQRRTSKRTGDDRGDESLLRFDETVPIEVIESAPEEMKTLPESAYERFPDKISYRLAQRPGAYVVLKYVRKVIKIKADSRLLSSPAPSSIFERSFVDVSLVANLFIDKLLYHLPLYRQHQRLAACGITLSRASLTAWFHRAADLLEPIYFAQLSSILQSEILLMDETPIRAGPVKKGKLSKGWYWPLFGDKSEVAFPFAASRSGKFAREVLGEFCGTLVTDGYPVYDRIAQTSDSIQHAQCWVHARRMFLKAEAQEPERTAKALAFIRALYEIEASIAGFPNEQRSSVRAERSKIVVDEFFLWLRDEIHRGIFLPKDPFLAAANYAFDREKALRVFLEDPAVPLDTNQVERALRPIPLGRKNWLFCWTEVGAEYVGQVQSLLATCKLHDVDPYTYLVDVLQRVATHPAWDVHLLTPRLWKENFADNPMRSDLDSKLRKNADH